MATTSDRKDDNLDEKTDTSTNDNKTSDQISSDANAEKKNEEQTAETVTTKTEETTTTVTSSNSTNDEDSKKEQLTAADATSSHLNEDKKKDENYAFPIAKGDEEHLTDFQRQKAKYFFNVNLDIENKGYVTWEDVEFYILFHLTAAGKEGSDNGDLEGRLSRATRAFWEHVHDQIPLEDGKRDRLTLDQFLDTWASLIDYVVENNQLPPIIQDLVKLGFELYSTNTEGGKAPTIQPQAFDQLFQKMNLGRPYAIMAYKYLTDNGAKPLDADKIDSIVKAVIISSDDEHESHFLIPGFFKTIAEHSNNVKEEKPPSPPVQDKEQAEVSDKPSTISTTVEPSSPPPAPPQPSNTPSSTPTSSSQEQQKPSEPSLASQPQQQGDTSSSPPAPAPAPKEEKKPETPPSTVQQPSSTSQSEVSKSSPVAPLDNQQQNVPPPQSQQAVIQQENEGIRRLLRYYHIDDGDIVEVAGGSIQRLVLVHPERPLPPYIQQNKQLLQKLQSDSIDLSSAQQNGPSNDQQSLSETKPKVTLEERTSRGEAHKGPTVPSSQGQKQDSLSSIGVRQVYPPLSAAQQEEQRKQAKLQANQSPKDEKQVLDDASTANDVTLSSKFDETKQTKDISRDDEEKIIASVLKQLEPIVEKRVAAELRRLHSDGTDQDEDDGFVPFPFMLGGGFPFFGAPRGGPPPQGSTEQPTGLSQGQQQQGNGLTEADFGGLPPGVGIFPPQLLMAMMNDLAQGGLGGEIHGFPPNIPPPPHGPAGVEGFMMFVDNDQLMGGPPGYPPHAGPRF